MARSRNLVAVLSLAFFACPAQRESVPLPETNKVYRNYETKIQPLLNARCVVCHSCYNAPCQLNLASFEGVERGANPKVVYEPTRLESMAPTRMFIDATSTEEWASKFGFFPVIARTGSPERNLKESVLYHLVKQRRSRGGTPKLEVDSNHFCPRTTLEADAELKAFAENGMPYGFPPLADGEFQTLVEWLEAGSPGPPEQNHAETHSAEIVRWETFFNEPWPKAKLSARYIYEHLFFAHLYFENGSRDFYRVVRSRTAAPKPVDEIPSVRPYDDPGGPFFYRLRRLDETIVEKTHVPYLLSDEKLSHLRKMFLETKWRDEEPKAPGYEPKVASNPFVAFAAIPPQVRYQFMLDDSYYHVRSFIHGPVCKGMVALDVIDEHFFIFFLDPNADQSVTQPRVLDETKDLLELPAEGADTPEAFYERFKVAELRYLKKRHELSTALNEPGRKLSDLWHGDGVNPGAVLTVYRHFDSATVSFGATGGLPKTLWVLDYPIFERMYYDLVAGFNVFGNVFHQVSTRRYMDDLRVESEDGFLRFLPKAQRLELRKFWYRGKGIDAYVALTDPIYDTNETKLKFKTPAEAKSELVNAFFADLPPAVRGENDPLNEISVSAAPTEAALRKLSNATQPYVQAFPDLALIHLVSPHGDKAFTVIRNKEHLNVSFMFLENAYRVPKEDTLQLARGIVGSYPNLFFRVNEAELSAFVEKVQAVKENGDGWAALLQSYAVPRTDARFWAESDWFNSYLAKTEPTFAGILDLTRYLND